MGLSRETFFSTLFAVATALFLINITTEILLVESLDKSCPEILCRAWVSVNVVKVIIVGTLAFYISLVLLVLTALESWREEATGWKAQFVITIKQILALRYGISYLLMLVLNSIPSIFLVAVAQWILDTGEVNINGYILIWYLALFEPLLLVATASIVQGVRLSQPTRAA